MLVSLKSFLFLFVILLSTNFIQCGETSNCIEHLDFYLDVAKWKQAFKNSNEQASIVEFTLKNENVNNWTELVTVQKFPPFESSVDQYYLLFVETLKKSVSPDPAYSRIINKKENSLLFEWWIPENSSFAQHEWFKLIKTPSSILILRYTTKKLEQVEKVRKNWEKILDSATSCAD